MGLVVSQQRREVLLATEDNGLNGVGLYAWIDTGVPIDAMQWCKSMASAEGGPFCYWVPKPSLSIFFCQPQFKDVGVWRFTDSSYRYNFHGNEFRRATLLLSTILFDNVLYEADP
jgi:hypothetical protein